MPDADTEFVERYRGLVESIARGLRDETNGVAELDEMVACGLLGLIEARQRFDDSRGVQFSTFAYYRIRGAILDGMGKTLHVPRSVLRQARALRVLAAESEYLAEGQKIGSAPDPKEAAVGALSEVLSRVATAYTMSVLADPTSTPEDKVAQGQSVEVMRAAALLLPERERRLIQEHYFGDRNLEDIGKELGLSKSWTSRLHAKALDHLRVLMVGEDGDEGAAH